MITRQNIRWFHHFDAPMIPIQKNQIEMFQKKSKKAWMFSTYVCTNYRKKSDPNSNCTVKNKKDKFSMNSVNKEKNMNSVKNTWFTTDLPFFYSQCVYRIGIRIYFRVCSQAGSRVGFHRVELYETHARIANGQRSRPTTLPMGLESYPCPNPSGNPTH